MSDSTARRKTSNYLAIAAVALSMIAVAYTVAGLPGLEPATQQVAIR